MLISNASQYEFWKYDKELRIVGFPVDIISHLNDHNAQLQVVKRETSIMISDVSNIHKTETI